MKYLLLALVSLFLALPVQATTTDIAPLNMPTIGNYPDNFYAHTSVSLTLTANQRQYWYAPVEGVHVAFSVISDTPASTVIEVSNSSVANLLAGTAIWGAVTPVTALTIIPAPATALRITNTSGSATIHVEIGE